MDDELSTLIGRYGFSLKPYALSLTGNNKAAQELMMDTVYKALSSKEAPTEKAAIKAWLCALMRDTFLERYQKL